jgi:hypothetical protein
MSPSVPQDWESRMADKRAAALLSDPNLEDEGSESNQHEGPRTNQTEASKGTKPKIRYLSLLAEEHNAVGYPLWTKILAFFHATFCQKKNLGGGGRQSRTFCSLNIQA